MKKWWFLKQIMYLKSSIFDREHCQYLCCRNCKRPQHTVKKEKDNLKRYIVWKARKGKYNCVLFSKENKGAHKVNVRMKNSSRKLRAPEHTSHESALYLICNSSAATSSKWLRVSADPEWRESLRILGCLC